MHGHDIEIALQKLLKNFHEFSSFFRKKIALERKLASIHLSLGDIAEVYYDKNKAIVEEMDKDIGEILELISALLKICRKEFELDKHEIDMIKRLKASETPIEGTEKHILNLHIAYAQIYGHLKKQGSVFKALKEDSDSVIRTFRKRKKIQEGAVKALESLRKRIRELEDEEFRVWNELVSVARMLESDGKLVTEGENDAILKLKQEIIDTINLLEQLYKDIIIGPEKGRAPDRMSRAEVLKRVHSYEEILAKKEEELKAAGVKYPFGKNDVYSSLQELKKKDGREGSKEAGREEQEAA